MADLYDWAADESGAVSTYPQVALADIVENYDIVSANDGYMVVSPRTIQLDEPNFGEIGSTQPPTYSGTSNYGSLLREEYNAKLRGQDGLLIYDKMRRSDAQVRMSLRLLKTPILAGRWYIEPASNSARDRRIAEYVWDNLTKWMSVSWPQLLTEILCFADFGFYTFETVYTMREGKVAWQKFAPRHPLDWYEWDLDSHGGPKGAWFYGPRNAEDNTYIPIEKMLIFTFDKEGGDLCGIPVLRSAYKHWYFKENLYKIDAIQKERHGIGIPIIKLPVGYTSADKQAADNLGRNMRTNEKAHITLPPLWEILMLKLEGNPMDCMVSIEHHDKQILNNVLYPFAEQGDKDSQQIFLKGTRFIAEVIRDTFNHYAIPPLVKYNWGENADPPELRVRRIGDTIDWRTISFAMRNFIGAGILTPDDRLESWVRDEMDMPQADPATARSVATPQKATTQPQAGAVGQGAGGSTPVEPSSGAPGAPQPPAPARVGAPRQATAPGSTQGRTAGSNGRVGRDGSGG